MIAKRIRTSPLPIRARPELIPPSPTLTTHPQTIQILEPTRPRAAERRDKAATRGTRVLIVDPMGGLVVCVAAGGENVIGGLVENGVGTV